MLKKLAFHMEGELLSVDAVNATSNLEQAAACPRRRDRLMDSYSRWHLAFHMEGELLSVDAVNATSNLEQAAACPRSPPNTTYTI